MRSKGNQRLFFIAALLILALLVFCYELLTDTSVEEDSPDPQDRMLVHFIDVGQGDAAIVQAPEGNIIIDTGTVDSREGLIGYIDSLGIDTFAYAIFTHPHADHIGGAAKVLKTYTVENVILPDAVNTNYTFENMLDAVEQENCKVIEGKAGVSFAVGDVAVDLLAPVYADDSNLNNMSVVAKVTYGEIAFLFTGDAEMESESAMLMTDEAILDCDILKLGHHGSSTSSAWEFLEAVSPDIAIASCGYANDYGHPHREIVSRLANMEIPLYRTYETGDILISTDGKTYQIQTKK